MNKEQYKISTGIKVAGNYQLIRKQPPGGGGPTFIGMQIEKNIPVHVRFFPPEEISDMKKFNQKLLNAKNARELSPYFVSLPSDYGFHEDIPYAVYGISNLKTLQAFLQDGEKLSGSEIKSLIEVLLKMLVQVHSGGIAHLGLSPVTIHKKKGGFPSSDIGILDFGLTPERGHNYFTRPAVDEKLLSIAAYASPQQANESNVVDHRTDLYSAGAIAYRLIIGKAPFEGGSTKEILKKIQTETPRGLSEEEPGPLKRINEFLSRALERDILKRFQSAADMLESFLSSSEELVKEGPIKAVSAGSPKASHPSKPFTHIPIVILKVGEKEAAQIDGASVEEITAEVISQADTITHPHKKTIPLPEAVKDREDKLPPPPSGTAGGEKPGDIQEKPQLPKPVFKPKKAKDKTELFIKVAVSSPEPPEAEEKGAPPPEKGDKKEMKGVLSTFLSKKPMPITPTPGEALADEKAKPGKEHSDLFKPSAKVGEKKASQEEYFDFMEKETPAPKEKDKDKKRKAAPPPPKSEKKDIPPVPPVPVKAKRKVKPPPPKAAVKKKPEAKPILKMGAAPDASKILEEMIEDRKTVEAKNEKPKEAAEAAAQAAGDVVEDFVKEDTLNLKKIRKRNIKLSIGIGAVALILIITFIVIIVAIAKPGDKSPAVETQKATSDKVETQTETAEEGETQKDSPATEEGPAPAPETLGPPPAGEEKASTEAGDEQVKEPAVQPEKTKTAKPAPEKAVKKNKSAAKKSKKKPGTPKKKTGKKKKKKKFKLEFVD